MRKANYSKRISEKSLIKKKTGPVRGVLHVSGYMYNIILLIHKNLNARTKDKTGWKSFVSGR